MIIRLTVLTTAAALFALSFSVLVQTGARHGGSAWASSQSEGCALREGSVCRVHSGTGFF